MPRAPADGFGDDGAACMLKVLVSGRVAAGWHAMACIVVPLLCACGPDKAVQTRETDVLARVNGTEITVRQLDQRAGDAGLPAEAERSRLLDALIDEQLLVQRAIDKGLDRDATTQAAMERARRQLLAQAAMERFSGDSSVGDEEARDFYRSHPQLYGARKVYALRRFVVPEGAIDPRVRAKLDRARNATEVSKILGAARIRFAKRTELRTAESLPGEILARASRMSPGDILLYRQAAGTVLIQLADSYLEPVGFELALPEIKAHLARLKRAQLADGALKQLRREARIEYATHAAVEPVHTTVAAGKSDAGEPPPQKLLQSGQITVVR